MKTMDSKAIKDVIDLTKDTVSTAYNIAQMARYRYQYTLGKKLQQDCPAQVNACELAQNRDKMIYHTCLAGFGVLGLFAIGIASMICRE